MHQKGRGQMRQGLLIGLLTLIASVVMATAVAQVTNIDFQVIHLPRLQRYPDAQYVAIRTPEEWAALWPEKSKDPNAAPIPNIDFKHFILLIAQTGVKQRLLECLYVRGYPSGLYGRGRALQKTGNINTHCGNRTRMSSCTDRPHGHSLLRPHSADHKRHSLCCY